MTRYEFALLRYMPDPTAGEFANIGVVLLDVENRRLFARVTPRHKRVTDFFGDVSGTNLRGIMRQLERSIEGLNEELRQPNMFETASPTLPGVLRKLLGDDESCLTASRTMSGLEEDPSRRVEELFEEFVSRHETVIERQHRDEGEMKRDINRRLSQTGLIHKIQQREITGPHFQFQFQYGWMNGRPQVMEPISFDLLDPGDIRDKAAKWSGRLLNLSKADFRFTAIVAAPTDKKLHKATEDAVAMLRIAPNVREVVLDTNLEAAIELIRADTSREA